MILNSALLSGIADIEHPGSGQHQVRILNLDGRVTCTVEMRIRAAVETFWVLTFYCFLFFTVVLLLFWSSFSFSFKLSTQLQ